MVSKKVREVRYAEAADLLQEPVQKCTGPGLQLACNIFHEARLDAAHHLQHGPDIPETPDTAAQASLLPDGVHSARHLA